MTIAPGSTGSGAQRGSRAVLTSLVVTLLSGCAFPIVGVGTTPASLTLLAGETGTVTVTTGAPRCDPMDLPEPCVDISGQVFGYAVENLPAGVTHRIDTSLQSPSTPGIVRITFEATAAAAPGLHDVVIRALLTGHSLGKAALPLRILSPTGAGATVPVAALAAGGGYSLVVLGDGTLRAWGGNADGQLGLGDRVDRSTPTAVPVPVSVRAVAGSRFPAAHTLALGTDGSVWAWGRNHDGQLGLGDHVDRTSPRQVPGLQDVEAIAAGLFFSLALTSDGRVWSWGRGGRLGDSTLNHRSSPGPVQGPSAIQAIAAGISHSLALAADGTVWAWGFNIDGALGDGTRGGGPRAPVLAAGLSDIVAIAAGNGHSLALRADGTVWAWGRNSSGQLGDGTDTDRLTAVQVSGLTGVRAIAAGDEHSLALAGDGSVWVWGQQPEGDPQRLIPVQVSDLSGVRAIAAGFSHSLAVVECGQLWAWGLNLLGQLGDGTRQSRLAPLPVPGLGAESACPRLALRVSVAGDGSGSVTGSAGELSCRDRECFGIFDRGSAVILTARPAGDSVFEGWVIECEGQGLQTAVVLDRSRQCAAQFRDVGPAAFLLTVLVDGGRVTSSAGGVLGPASIACEPTCSAIFPQSTQVALAATDAGGFGFTGWGLDCSGTERETSVVMDARHTCRALFRPFTLTVAVSGEGWVTSDPPGLDCAPTCSYAPRTETALLRAEPAPGWQFDGWSGDCTGTDRHRTVAMDADRACTASFSRIPDLFFLTMLVEGQGSVTSVPAGIDCPDQCVALYPAGTVVDLAAVETPQSLVLNWFDDCAAPGVLTSRVVMDADRTCRIRFTDRPAVPVAMFAFEPGPYPAGAVITFDGSASHVLDPVTGAQDLAGITVFSWDFDSDGTIDATGPRGTTAIVQHAFQTAGTHTVRLRVRGGPFDDAADRQHDVTVVDPARTLYALTVQKAGDGGGTIVTSPPGLIGCGPGCPSAGPVHLEEGTVVTLVAQAEPGSTFTGWSGIGCTSGSASVPVTMSADRICTAGFSPVSAEPTLTVVVDGLSVSFGNVTGEEPPGNPIDCGGSGAVCTATFAPGTTVVLRPNSAIFELGLSASWSGCDSIGFGFTCTVTMMGDRTVTLTISP